MTSMPFRFRVPGREACGRWLVSRRATFAADTKCNPKAHPQSKAHLSNLVFGQDLAGILRAGKNGKGLQRPLRGRPAVLGQCPRSLDLALAQRGARPLAGRFSTVTAIAFVEPFRRSEPRPNSSEFHELDGFDALAHALLADAALDSGLSAERSEATDRLRSGSRPTTTGRGRT